MTIIIFQQTQRGVACVTDVGVFACVRGRVRAWRAECEVMCCVKHAARALTKNKPNLCVHYGA